MGEPFVELYQELNAWFADRAGAEPQLVVPFARCEETGVVAAFHAVPARDDVLLLQPGAQPEILALLPSLAAWVRLAVDDMIRTVGGASSEPREPTYPGGAATPAPLPFESEGPEEEPDPRTSTRRHLMRTLRESEVDLEFVSAEAGDQPLSASARRRHGRVRAERGEELFADMLFVLTQQRYPTRLAKWLWCQIVQHKQTLSRQLGRAVEMSVASLDFLNQHEHLVDGSLVLCSEDELTQVAEVALRDGLTRLFDQATLRARLRREIERARRYGGPLSLLMLDLDHFKRLNDEHGHGEGDRVLAEVGRIFREELRAVDVPARYGGEEFAVILPETDIEEAALLAERLRLAIAERFSDGLNVTVSVGVASLQDGYGDAEAFLAAADAALYRSKELGRDRTTCARSPSSARA